jgi:hypothetical protein
MIAAVVIMCLLGAPSRWGGDYATLPGRSRTESLILECPICHRRQRLVGRRASDPVLCSRGHKPVKMKLVHGDPESE